MELKTQNSDLLYRHTVELVLLFPMYRLINIAHIDFAKLDFQSVSMNSNTSNIPRMNRLRLPLMSVGSIVLRIAVLLALGFFPSISPGIAVPLTTESEAPYEHGESTETVVVLTQTRLRGCGDHVDRGSPIGEHQACTLALTSTRVVPVGHRLPNNLLAPLRC